MHEMREMQLQLDEYARERFNYARRWLIICRGKCFGTTRNESGRVRVFEIFRESVRSL